MTEFWGWCWLSVQYAEPHNGMLVLDCKQCCGNLCAGRCPWAE